jgi:hypothetical protein
MAGAVAVSSSDGTRTSLTQQYCSERITSAVTRNDGDDQRNGKPISAGWLWYQRRWRKEKWTSLFVAVARPVQAGAGQAERRPGAARPDCVPHATAADAAGNDSLREVQVNSMAVRISTTKTVLPCRQHHCWQPAKSRDLPIRRKIGVRLAPQQVGRLGRADRRPTIPIAFRVELERQTRVPSLGGVCVKPIR